MWRRTYLLLILLRVYFALSPSYLHPDEVFQGPEIIAGALFPYPSHRTWEWTSDRPIRSVFPLWLFYGLPMNLLKSVWSTEGGLVEPAAIYYGLRLVMFILSFVLEDWAITELVPSPRRRYQVLILVASSYVTWTFQTHTFSNSIETLMVLWSIVLINRIDRYVKREYRTSFGSCFVLAFLLVLGFFNRITFPAFVLIPGMRLLPHFTNRPSIIFVLALSIVFWTLIAVATDTAYYAGGSASNSFRVLFTCLRNNPVITPLNNINYNKNTSNLAQHGLHPRYQHTLVNLPQLLGPALLLIPSSFPLPGSRIKTMLQNPRFTSAITGIIILSIFPHQELRFLLPCVPLLLTCAQLPDSRRLRKLFWITWSIFNIILGILMGVYHQGGIIPAQIAMPSLISNSLNQTSSKATTSVEVFWWKTYPPPTYLLGTNNSNPLSSANLTITTTPLMGLSEPKLLDKLSQNLPRCDSSFVDKVTDYLYSRPDTYIVAPFSAWKSDNSLSMTTTSDGGSGGGRGGGYPPFLNFTKQTTETAAIKFVHLASFSHHINLDDLDFGQEGGIGPTLKRIVQRIGLGVWRVEGTCNNV